MEVLIQAFILVLFAQWENCIEAHSLETSQITQAENSCFPFDEMKPSHLLYTGNSTSGTVPVLQFKISEITSFESEFEVRTFDPEGIIFFGDMGGEHNWFLLALHENLLEIQIQNNVARATIDMGLNISDGEWRKITVLKQDSSVIVKVGNERVLKVFEPGVHTDINREAGFLRIAIGALFPNSSVTLAFNPHFDGCLRNWNWVKKDAVILKQLLESSESQRCWQNIAPGTYFPGFGAGVFEAQVFFSNSTDPDAEGWKLVVELAFRPVMDHGVLFAIVDSQNNISFSISMDRTTQDLILTIGSRIAGSLNFPPSLCSGESQFQQLTLTKTKLNMIWGTDEKMWNISGESFEALQSAWKQPGTMVSLGGLPESCSAAFSSYFHGCMQMKIQGNPVDLDKASVKHGGIRSHSCPSTLDLGDGK
ncbi:PROS protein, partial [Atractosteus spatula]|nr:PROS protein [Atractosteus spatula]